MCCRMQDLHWFICPAYGGGDRNIVRFCYRGSHPLLCNQLFRSRTKQLHASMAHRITLAVLVLLFYAPASAAECLGNRQPQKFGQEKDLLYKRLPQGLGLSIWDFFLIVKGRRYDKQNHLKSDDRKEGRKCRS